MKISKLIRMQDIVMGTITISRKGKRIRYQPGPRILPRVEEKGVQYVK